LGVNEDFFSALFYQADLPLTAAAPEKPPAPAEEVKTAEKIKPPARPDKNEPDSEVRRLGRQDYCSNCWERKTASGEEVPFSFWQTKYTKAPEPPKTSKQVLVAFFDNLFEAPKTPEADAQAPPASPEGQIPVIPTPENKLKEQAKYLFSLILLRKKILKLKAPIHKENVRYLVLERTVDNKIYEVPEVSISEQELELLREQFSSLFEFRI